MDYNQFKQIFGDVGSQRRVAMGSNDSGNTGLTTATAVVSAIFIDNQNYGYNIGDSTETMSNYTMLNFDLADTEGIVKFRQCGNTRASDGWCYVPLDIIQRVTLTLAAESLSITAPP